METELTVKADDGRLLSFLASDYADEKGTYLCHAYALTVYSAQGVTVDRSTFVYGAAGIDQTNSYVAMSRHKDESHLYIRQFSVSESPASLIKKVNFRNSFCTFGDRRAYL